jgi:hypothetical protein
MIVIIVLLNEDSAKFRVNRRNVERPRATGELTKTPATGEPTKTRHHHEHA